MNDNSNAAVVASPTYDRTAREARLEVLARHKAENGSMVNLSGNTWPLKGFLYTRGSLWNKETKTLQVPSCVHAECQAAIDGYAAAHPKVSKPKAAPIAKVAPVKSEPVKRTYQSAVGTYTAPSVLCQRLANLNTVTDTVVSDLLHAGHVEAAGEAVKAMAAFNAAHALLA